MKPRSQPAVFVLVALLFGCSSKSGTEAPELPAEKTYPETVETVNRAVMKALTGMGLEVDSFDGSTAVFRTRAADFVTQRSLSQYMYCGEGTLGAYTQLPGFKAEHVINFRLREIDGETGLLVRATFTGRTNGVRVGCRSSGEFERELIEAFDAAIASERG